MRNLVEYPITHDEIIRTLNEYLEDWQKRNANDPIYGDINGVCLQEAIRMVEVDRGVVYLKPMSPSPKSMEVMTEGKFTQEYIDMVEARYAEKKPF